MSYSDINHTLIIDDDNVDLYVHHSGYVKRDETIEPIGSLPCAPLWELPIFDRAEWPERLKDRRKKDAYLSQQLIQAGAKVKNQSSTNYCAPNATVGAAEALWVMQGQTYEEWSPASIGCLVTNYQNVGMWPTQCVRVMADTGIDPVRLWPANAIDRDYNTPESKAARKPRRVIKWSELPKFSFDHLATVHLMGFAAAAVYMRINHVVLSLDLEQLGVNTWATRIRNSYGESWGDHGYALFVESQSLPDEAVVPRVVMSV